jgi:DNA polymerase V
VDEAFLNLSLGSVPDPVEYAGKIRYTVGRWVGIPTSIGIAPSKTLAKLASKRAKKLPAGVFRISQDNLISVLDETSIGDVWNIGRQSAAKLERYGVRTAGDLARKEPSWVKKMLTVSGLLTMMELRGVQLTPLVTLPKPPKSIQVSHAFGEPLSSLDEIEKPLIEHSVKAGAKLRVDRLAARSVSVNLRHGFLSREHGYFGDGVVLDRPIFSDRDLIRVVLWVLRRIYKSDVFYTQSGIYLTELSDASYRQKTLF